MGKSLCTAGAFSGKTVLVTGGASGIGKAIVACFAETGANVCILDLQDGPGILKVDVSVEEEVIRGVAEAVAHHGSLDVLVNNAGIEVAGEVTLLAAADWDRQIAVNLRGPFLCAKHSLPHLKPRHGAIVNISSIDAFVSYAGLAAYDASKAAVVAFTRTLALECARDKVRVNTVCPGYIETPLLQAYFDRESNPEKARAEAEARHPLGRLGTPEDVAEAVVFLASERAGFITGTTLIVDGGITAKGH